MSSHFFHSFVAYYQGLILVPSSFETHILAGYFKSCFSHIFRCFGALIAVFAC